jgi:hypothetical protein
VKNLGKLFGIISIIAIIACAITACELFETPNQTPVAGDYEIGNLKQSNGSVTAVTITPKSGKSSGAITIYYEGTGGSAKNTKIPQDDGAYIVTFDVAAASGWNAASGLYAGTLIVGIPTPVASDFTISNLAQTTGHVTSVSITPKANRSTGRIKIYYTGTGTTNYPKSETVPTTAASGSEYAVTFDVAEANGWKAATGLSAGTLEINDNKTPVVGDYNINGTGIFTHNGSAKTVTVTKKDDSKSPGSVTVKYNGNTAAPSAEGNYTITFDVAEANGWNAATDLPAGTLSIIPANSVPPLSVTIIGTPGVGNKLKAEVIRNISGTVEYQWFKNGSPMRDYWYYDWTEYIPEPADSGKEISVKVRCGSTVVESAKVTIPSPSTFMVELVAGHYYSSLYWIMAYAKIGDGEKSWPADEDNGFSCQWTGENAASAWKNRYSLEEVDKDKPIKVNVTYISSGKSVPSKEITIGESYPSLEETTWGARLDNYNYELEFYPVYNIWEMRYNFYNTYQDTYQDGELYGTYTVNEDDKVVLFNLNEEGKLEGVINGNKIVFPDMTFTERPN